MRRKLEDQLLQLSFGDLSPEEAQKVKARAANDPEAQKLLQDYSSIRSNLKLLKDIPADQLSTERMRLAILEKGMRRESSGSARFGWMWAPVSVACLAFAIVTLRSHPNQVIPANGNLNAAVAKVMPTPSFDPGLKAPTTVTQPIVVPRPQQTLVARVGKRHKTELQFAMAKPTDDTRIDTILTSVHKAIDQAPNTTVDSALADSGKEALVMIGNDSDEDTGAKKATEVDNANDILISG